MNNAVIIFIKNPIQGKVKTRLSATIGNEKALAIYLQLVRYTLRSVKDIMADVFLYFSDTIDESVPEFDHLFFKKCQSGSNLGERMNNSFAEIFALWYDKVIIIGTDCPEINLDILDDAFYQLENSDVVIGPAYDGGYYLLGIKQQQDHIFIDIPWSTTEVLAATVAACCNNNLSYTLLPARHDIDKEEDLVHLDHLNK